MSPTNKAVTVLRWLDAGGEIAWPSGHTFVLAETPDGDSCLACKTFDQDGKPLEDLPGVDLSLTAFLQDCAALPDDTITTLQANLALSAHRRSSRPPPP